MNLLLNLGKDPTMAPFPALRPVKIITGFSCKEIKNRIVKTTSIP
ncbi:MAG: hypothetical protein ACLRXQ_13315 [Phascolarctobacterium faecium]